MKKRLILLCFCLLFFLAHSMGQAPRSGMSFFDDAFSRMERAFLTEEATSLDAYYLGRTVAANILAAYKPYTGNPALTHYVNRICQTIVINSAYPDLYNGYHVMILDSAEFNAFASPGGHIFLTLGLVEAAASEDMLAAIIAHELAHIMLKHSISIIEDMRFFDERGEMAARAAEFAGQYGSNAEASLRALFFRESVAATIDALVKYGYSRDQEFEADDGAVVLLAAAGYSPEALLEMLAVLQRVQGSQKGGFNSTHPTPAQRIENARGYVNHYRIQDTRSFREPRFINK